MNFLSWFQSKVLSQRHAHLVFLNQTRAYNETKNCVTFWGFEGSFEISFDLPEDELQLICSHTSGDEASILSAFDEHRDAIERWALKAHKNARQRHHILRSSVA